MFKFVSTLRDDFDIHSFLTPGNLSLWYPLNPQQTEVSLNKLPG